VVRPGLRLIAHIYILSSLSTRRVIITFFRIPSWSANGRLYLYICLYQGNNIPISEALLLTVFHWSLQITLWKKNISQNEVVNFFLFFFLTVYLCSAHACHAVPSVVHAIPTPRGVYTVQVKVKKFGGVSCSRKRIWLMRWARWSYSSRYGTWAKWM
jgi:hypothetical protein